MFNLKTRLKDFYYLKIKKKSIYEYNVFRMRQKGIAVGENCHICTYIQTIEPSLIKIGNNVTISNQVTFCTHDNAICRFHPEYTDVVGAIEIGDNCFIGMNAIIMLGVSIGDHCIVGAGSVVTKNVESGSVVAGNPARYICSSEEYLQKNLDYGINFRVIPFKERSEYFKQHPEKIIHKSGKQAEK